MKKLAVSIGAVILMFCTSGVFAQAVEQVNPVVKGNLVVKLFDMGYSFARSGDLYENDDADILGINDSHAGFMYDGIFPVGTEINYFVMDGIALGGSIHFVNTEEANGDSLNIWSAGPSIYYYYNIDGSLLPYITVSYIYSKIKSGDSIDRSFERIPLGGGVTLMMGKYIGVYGQFVYSFNKFDSGSDKNDGKMAIITFGVKAFF